MPEAKDMMTDITTDTARDKKMPGPNNRMTRQELENFIVNSSVEEIVEFIIRRQVERYSEGFDFGYDLGTKDGIQQANEYWGHSQ